MSSSEFLQRTRRNGDGVRIVAALACASWLAGGCAYVPWNAGPGSEEPKNEEPASEEGASELALELSAGEPYEDPTPPEPKPETPKKPKPNPKPRASGSTARKPTPRPAAPASFEPPSPTYVESDLLEIERSGGKPVAVLLEAGASEGLRRGMLGELVDRGQVIGQLEIIAVYDEGSRARIVGELSVPITFDTAARIQN
jgi:hypothetical protein